MAVKDDVPENWDDLTEREKRALLRAARSQLWWEDFWSRMTGLKTAGTVFLTLVAAWTLLGEVISKWLSK